MASSLETWKAQGSYVEDIEQQMEDFLTAQKERIEHSLMEKISREKEDARKKIETMEMEFEKEKNLLDEYKTVLAELRAAKEDVVKKIRGHFDRALDCQKEIRTFSEKANAELQEISELSRELEHIRARVEEENARLRTTLEERFGIEARLPEAFEFEDVPAEWIREVSRMEKLRELLATFDAPGNGAAAGRQDVHGDDGPDKGNGAGTEARVPETMPEDIEDEDPAWEAEAAAKDAAEDAAGIKEDTEAGGADEAGGVASWAGISAEVKAIIEAQDDEAEDAGFDAVDAGETREASAEGSTDDAPAAEPASGETPYESLARFKRLEPIANGSFFGYFDGENARVLDGETFGATMNRVVGEAGRLHSELVGKESIKDVFMLKQDILNEQEILRKLFFRAITFCEKEDGLLPGYLTGVISPEIIKDVLELLTIGNWSDVSEFNAFMRDFAKLKEAFSHRLENIRDYAESILDQIQ